MYKHMEKEVVHANGWEMPSWRPEGRREEILGAQLLIAQSPEGAAPQMHARASVVTPQVYSLAAGGLACSLLGTGHIDLTNLKERKL